MYIEIREQAKHHTLKKGFTSIVIDAELTNLCWGRLYLPNVYLGNPKDHSQFEVFKIDGIDVFVNRKLDIKESGLKIFTSGFLFFKTVDVSGINLI